MIALNRASGEQIWAQRLVSTSFANVVVEDEGIFATTNGEIYCLDPVTGDVRWHNKLKGYGTGLATIATSLSIGGKSTSVMAEKQRRDQQAATSAATAAVITST